ncbi:MAG: EamA family transporter [Chloroflexota bacterium]
MSKQPSYPLAIFEAIVVNIVWASSFVFVKMALPELGPLTIGGLRYFLGFLILFPFLLRRKNPTVPSRQMWWRYFLIGISAYTIGNGATFWSLKYLPATTVSFLMGTITLMILFGGILWLRELPNRVQAGGIFITLAGTGMFFANGLRGGEPRGLGILAVGLLAFTLFGLLGRGAARDGSSDTLSLTAWPLALGGGIMLLLALLVEGLPQASLRTWGLIFWLAVVNTSLAYILYNHALRVLTAFQMNILLNLSPIWTALMSATLLDEFLTPWQWIGMLTVIVGVGLAQYRSKKPSPTLPIPVSD